MFHGIDRQKAFVSSFKRATKQQKQPQQPHPPKKRGKKERGKGLEGDNLAACIVIESSLSCLTIPR